MKAKNCVVLHGRPGEDEYYDLNQPSASNAHWLAWLQNSLLVNDIHCSTPEVPLLLNLNMNCGEKNSNVMK